MNTRVLSEPSVHEDVTLSSETPCALTHTEKLPAMPSMKTGILQTNQKNTVKAQSEPSPKEDVALSSEMPACT